MPRARYISHSARRALRIRPGNIGLQRTFMVNHSGFPCRSRWPAISSNTSGTFVSTPGGQPDVAKERWQHGLARTVVSQFQTQDRLEGDREVSPSTAFPL